MSPKVRTKLSLFRQIFFREKYRFDQGNAFLVFANFALLVISLVKLTGGDDAMIGWYIGGGLIGTWLLGYILDRVIRVQDALERVSLKRSPIWQEVFTHHKNQHEKMDDIDQKILEINKKIVELKELLREN